MNPRALLAAGLAAAVLSVVPSSMAQDKKGAGDAAKGKEVFEQCSVCHNADSEEKKMGPGLKGLYKRPKLVNGKAVTDENVRSLINAGGNGMPGYQDLLTDEERDHVLAFLKSL